MSMTTFTGSASRDTAAYGGFVDAIGGVATIVLAIIGLSGAKPEMLIAIATIVFGRRDVVRIRRDHLSQRRDQRLDGALRRKQSFGALPRGGRRNRSRHTGADRDSVGDFDLGRAHRLWRRAPGIVKPQSGDEVSYYQALSFAVVAATTPRFAGRPTATGLPREPFLSLGFSFTE